MGRSGALRQRPRQVRGVSKPWRGVCPAARQGRSDSPAERTAGRRGGRTAPAPTRSSTRQVLRRQIGGRSDDPTCLTTPIMITAELCDLSPPLPVIRPLFLPPLPCPPALLALLALLARPGLPLLFPALLFPSLSSPSLCQPRDSPVFSPCFSLFMVTNRFSPLYLSICVSSSFTHTHIHSSLCTDMPLNYNFPGPRLFTSFPFFPLLSPPFLPLPLPVLPFPLFPLPSLSLLFLPSPLVLFPSPPFPST